MGRKYESSKEYLTKQSELYPLVLRALRICDFSITEESRAAYKVQGEIKWSLSSWGERYTVSVVELNDYSKIHFQSKCKIPTQIIDLGKNRKNAERFYKTLDELLDFYQEIKEDRDEIIINIEDMLDLSPEERQKIKDAREKYKGKNTEKIIMHSPKFKQHSSTIDLTELLKPYHNKDLHLAVTKDYSKVVGTGKTIEEAAKAAEDAGYKDFTIMHSPDDTLGKRI